MIKNYKDYSCHHEITHFPDLIIKGRIDYSDKIYSFCPYFRLFLWKLFIVIPIIVGVIGGVLGWYFASLAYMLTTFDFSFNVGRGYEIWLGFNGILITSITLFSIWLFFYNKHIDRKEKRKLDKNYIPLKPSLFKMWWDKVHYKICPTMDY